MTRLLVSILFCAAMASRNTSVPFGAFRMLKSINRIESVVLFLLAMLVMLRKTLALCFSTVITYALQVEKSCVVLAEIVSIWQRKRGMSVAWTWAACARKLVRWFVMSVEVVYFGSGPTNHPSLTMSVTSSGQWWVER